MLKVKNLEVGYGEIQVVWGVSFEVPEGAIIALIGSNGAGKSTTLRAMFGLLPTIRGTVEFRGETITGKATHNIVRAGLGMVPESRATFSTMSVIDNLQLGAFTDVARPYKDQTLQEVFEIFPRLEERQSQLAGTLSGGERQMLAIGKALMARPDMLVLDEPSLGLAPLIVDRIFDVIDQINQRGVSILLVEQNVQLTLEIAHYAYIMELGNVVNEGDSQSLLQDNRVQEAYLSL